MGLNWIWSASTADERRASLAEAETRFLRQFAGLDRAEQLTLWREWIAKKLLADFALPADQAKRDRLVGQCIGVLEKLVRQLLDRGWLVNIETLKTLVEACLAPISAAQRAGKVDDFWPFFRASVLRYVPYNADQIQRDARRSGADVTQSMGAVMAGVVGRLTGPSIVEIIAEPAKPVQAACKPVIGCRGRPRKDTGDETLSLFG